MWSESDRKGRLRFWWLEGVAYVKSYVVCVFLGGGHEFEIINLSGVSSKLVVPRR